MGSPPSAKTPPQRPRAASAPDEADGGKPPLGGVERRRTVELRIHGVSGTPPEIMLDDPHPVQISGDETGRIFRRRSLWPGISPRTDRVVEGYHWGRYTAGSATRALWLLLLPFAVLNLARFA